MADAMGDVPQPATGRRLPGLALPRQSTTATLRAHLIHVPARLARTARTKLTAHLPGHWPWRDAWLSLFNAVHRPPSAT
jgi:hypothetical protein